MEPSVDTVQATKTKRKKALSLKLNFSTEGLGRLGFPTSAWKARSSAPRASSPLGLSADSEEPIRLANSTPELEAETLTDRRGLNGRLRERESHEYLLGVSLRRDIEFPLGLEEVKPRNGGEMRER